jgi:hypothetical protein
MGRKSVRVASLALVVFLLLAGTALAIVIRAGNIVVTGDGGFTPRALPKNVNAPITVFGHGKISTVDGSIPPVIKTIQFEFDKHGAVDTTGLPFCTTGKLQARTVTAARKACPDAIVGKGVGHAVVVFPEQAPIPISSPITLFNGPKIGGDPSMIAHFYTTIPGPVAIVIPIRIETIHAGRYGYRVATQIPKLAGGYGVPISGSIRVGRKWTYKGKKHSFINARCADNRLQARGEFIFKDGTDLVGSFLKTCTQTG